MNKTYDKATLNDATDIVARFLNNKSMFPACDVEAKIADMSAEEIIALAKEVAVYVTGEEFQ